jgi:hypothetical protein
MTSEFPASLLRASCASVLLLCSSACAPATRAAFVPQLDLGLRSVRSTGRSALDAALRSSRRWDVTLFARLAWRSRRAVELIPTARSLSPDAWDASCTDPQCDFRDPDDSEIAPWLGAEP